MTYGKKTCALKVHCINSIVLTPNGGLLLQEPAKVTFAAAEYQYSGTAAIFGFCYLKVIYCCHWFLLLELKREEGKICQFCVT